MKKHILNRPMFRQVKSPAYGTGIASNLVSNEERQRYNYGGRVGFEEAGSVGFKKSPFMKQMRSIGEPLWNYGLRPVHNLARYPLNWVGEAFGYSDVVPEAPEIDITAPGEQFYPYIDTSLRDAKAPPKKPSDAMIASEQLETSFPRDAEEMAVTTPDQETRSTEEIIADETIRQRGQLGGKDLTKFREKEQETETIDTDPFGFLDESIEAKKKLGRGNALMKAAAAAVKWGGAPTAEKRAAAISEGLTGFGDEASKATLAGMDLKDRAKILAAVEDTKQKGKKEIKEMDIKSKEWQQDHYKKTRELQEKIAFNRNQGKGGLEIYNEALMSGELKNPLLKGDTIYALTGKKIPIAISEDQEKIFKMPKNDGQIFIDKDNQIVKYINGEKKGVDEKSDEFFTWN